MHVGVLTINKQPIYIVEVMEESNMNPMQYATVYAVERDSKPPIKAYDRIVSAQEYKSTTLLGELATKLYKPKRKETKRDKPPLFMTDIIYGKDTFTGKEGRGFYEREKDKTTVQGGKLKVVYGQPTGVFIGLDSIGWTKLVIAPEDVVKEYQARKMLWYL